jgi:Leu/Phe-tRNA-protein transferase
MSESSPSDKYSCAQPVRVLAAWIQHGYNVCTTLAQIDEFEKLLARNREFCVVQSVQPAVIDRACVNGVFPMSIGGFGSRIGALKLHDARCVLRLDQLRCSKSTRRQAKKFTLSTNTAYELVVAGCIKQHGRDWLMQPLVAAFCDMFRQQRRDSELASAPPANADDGSAPAPPPPPPPQSKAGHQVRLHSIELWQDGKLVAGELGFSVGSIYTSQTGFYTVSGSGSVQLLALGLLLRKRGCTLWDFGMAMEYKMDLGATTMPRAEWRQTIRAAAGTGAVLLLDQLDRTTPIDASE